MAVYALCQTKAAFVAAFVFLSNNGVQTDV